MTPPVLFTIPAPSSARVPLAVVVLVHYRDGFACVYCGAMPDAVHVDHVRPLAHFAAAAPASTVNAPANLVTACAGCNQGKGPQGLRGFAETLRGRGLPSKVVARMVRKVNVARRRPLPVPFEP